MRPVLCLVCWACAGAALAQSPSDAMAHCSALAFVTAEFSDTPDRQAALLEISERWFDAALDQAQAEGKSQAFEALTQLANAREAEWLPKGPTWRFTGEFREWSDACARLASQVGLEIGAN